jgi:hypothetical protein
MVSLSGLMTRQTEVGGVKRNSGTESILHGRLAPVGLDQD